MKFEYDIYLSFSKRDNQPLPGEDKGWVTNFYNYLEIRLTQLLRARPKILYYGNGEKPVAAELSKVCIMIAVISPEYCKATDCLEDIEIFYEEIQKREVTGIDQRSRLIKVVKFPVPFEVQHSGIRSSLGHDMFRTDPVSGHPKELENFFDAEAEKNFWMKLDDLAHDIFEILKDVKVEREQAIAAKNADTVYLAETGYDLTLARDLVKRELQRHGYKVLPDQELPVNPKEMEIAVRKDLRKSKLSIHLIGDSYGDIPLGSEKSIVDIQNQLAAEHSLFVKTIPEEKEISDFSRLIWVSPHAKFANERQKDFVETLRRDAEKMNGAELIRTSIEDLKNIIRNKLLGDKNEWFFKTDDSVDVSSAFPKVYLIYDGVDAQAGKSLAQIIEAKGNEVLHPKLKGGLLDIRSSHFDNLRKCDVAMIYYGNVNEQWVQMKVLDILKAPGLGRVKPMISKSIFVEQGPKLNKEKFKDYNISIIENLGNHVVSLDPFMAKINKLK